MSKQNDRALRIYNEVLGLERLHYGIWLPDDELSTEKLKEAQERYEDYLVENIPDNVASILDVGCGTGILTKKLIGLGYDVEGLSPDITQKNNFIENINATFHHSTFDDFSVADRYDCLIMSESAQYIQMDKIFENAAKSLKKDGYLMICDYFVLPNATGVLSKSGHDFEDFMDHIKNNNFTVIAENDITEQVTKTLDFGKNMIEKVYKAIEIGTEKIREKYPRISKLVLRLFKNKIDKLKRQTQLLDSDGFKLNKTYRFVLLQLKS
ncbi:MAG: class I SAM-dependent methyltransferase [Porticoccaceae bacterium]|nr:class I SAM-dependent methyltransferase [Porticoccaceae bacterium]